MKILGDGAQWRRGGVAVWRCGGVAVWCGGGACDQSVRQRLGDQFQSVDMTTGGSW
ncbi:MAG: hypothetical protein K0U66_08090 [Gammaproteobacteria bacterium]|nr:hypothetical protein [Gammaproteobacteria bacterium]